MAGTFVRNPRAIARLLGGGPRALQALEAGFSTIATVTSIKTADYTAADGDFIPVNATAANRTVTLPAPAAGARVVVKLLATASSHTLTVARSASGVKIDGTAADLSTSTAGTTFWLYSDGTDWFHFPGAGATGATGATGPAGPADTVVSKTAAYNAVSGDLVLASAVGGNFAVTLPVPTNGVKVTVKNSGASGSVTVAPHVAETIEGAASKVLAAGESAVVVANGTNWFII